MQISTVIKYIRRSPYQAISALMIMTLTFFAVSVFALLTIVSVRLINYFESRPQLTVFFKDTAKQEEIVALQRKIEDTGKAASITFVSKEDVMRINEEVLIETIKNLYPEKRIQEIPFPRMSYKEAMETYGNDRPDIREDKNDPNLLAFLWIVDFPMFEKTDDENVDGTGEWTFTHNPFSRPEEEHMEMFMKKENIGDIISTQYDITLNGFEIGGGSIRNHNSDALKTTFEIMGYNEDRIEKNFGHMLKALSFGAPPHGGIAWGFDRLMMVLENEQNIREVIPFAKTGDGKDLMMDSPSLIAPTLKKELGL